ncbi:MAG: NAD(+)/NADH kinase [Deltaproteobacteria bacterium]|nr:NAD(+)/NADH kinase [Deltaproteobacteria bacterium]
MANKRNAHGKPSILIVYKPAPTPSRRLPARAIHAHLRTLEALYHLLQEWEIPFRAIPTEQIGPIRGADLVITVGGDGTVLHTSHSVQSQPILGVKSFGETSVGHFCAATRKSLRTDLAGIFAGRREPRALHRLAVTIDGHPLGELVLNDLLFAHASPAAISDYRLTIGARSEVQRSSGIWVSTAAGSTAAIQSAGGRAMPLNSRRMQYHIREPYLMGRRIHLRGGALPAHATIVIESLTRHGTLSIDGAHLQYPVPEGSVVRITGAETPLNIYWRDSRRPLHRQSRWSLPLTLAVLAG